MSRARGILTAAFVALAMTSAHALYRAWPVAYGAEIFVQAALFRQSADVALVEVRLPLARIALDVPHTTPAVTETFEAVHRIGDWWTTGGDTGANARTLRGRPLYLQLTPGPLLWPGGPAGMRPSTVSNTTVGGAINLAGDVTRVREDGYIWLGLPFGCIGVPREIASRARPLAVAAPGAGDAATIPPAADPGVFAVLRVLPSGRAALAGVIVDGKRY